MSQADLLHGAQLQLRGALRMKDFDRRRIPTRGLEAVLLPKELKANLDKIVHHEKVTSTLKHATLLLYVINSCQLQCLSCAHPVMLIQVVLGSLESDLKALFWRQTHKTPVLLMLLLLQLLQTC